MKSEDEAAAIACSLSSAEYRERRQRFANLNREFLLESRRLGMGLELIYRVTASTELQQLVELEEKCCPFLRFQLAHGRSSIKLSITAPENCRDSVDALLEPFSTT